MTCKNLLSILSLCAFLIYGCSAKSPYIARIESTPEYQCTAAENLKYRILFVGDAGDPGFGDLGVELDIRSDQALGELCPTGKNGSSPERCLSNPALVALYKQAAEASDKSTIIFLGDNIYPAGLSSQDDTGNAVKLDAQILAAKISNAKVFFVPGNHDWDEGGKCGLNNILEQGNYINTSINADNFHNSECFYTETDCEGIGEEELFTNEYFTPLKSGMLPKDGLPGPCKIDDIEGIRIIALDSQWWIHKYNKPLSRCGGENRMITTMTGLTGEASIDAGQVRKKAIAQVKTLLDTDDRETIIVSHHPVKSHGEHGGFYDYRYYFFPLTEVDKYLYIPLPPLYPPIRWYVVKDDQDIPGAEYQGLISDMAEMTDDVKKPLIIAAGHDHSLQVINGGEFARYVVVSGAGSEEKVDKSAVSYESDTYFSHQHTGFMQLDILKDNKMYLCVVEPEVNVKNGHAVISPDFIYKKQLR